MKLICEREALDNALGLVIGRARNKSKIPILSNVLLRVADSRLTVAATDLHSSSEASLPAEIAEEGATTVEADRFAQLVSLMPPGAQISLQMDGNQLTMTSGRSRYRLQTLLAEDWPEFPKPEAGAAEVSLPCAAVKRLFGEPAPMIRADASRPYLEGGCFYQFEPGRVSLAAMDGLRMVRISAPGPQTFGARLIVPKAAMSEIVKLATEGDVTFVCDDSLLMVQTRGCTFITRLIAGTYPNCERLIPEVTDQFIAMDRAELVAAMKRLDNLSNEYSVLNLRWEDGAQNVSLTLSGEGSGAETVACECGFPAGGISFKPRLLASVLSAFSGEIVRFHITSAQAAVRIVDPAGPEIAAMAMPCLPKE